MASMKLMAATVKKSPRQTMVEADKHQINTGITANLVRAQSQNNIGNKASRIEGTHMYSSTTDLSFYLSGHFLSNAKLGMVLLPFACDGCKSNQDFKAFRSASKLG